MWTLRVRLVCTTERSLRTAHSCGATLHHNGVPVGDGRQLGVHDGDRLTDGREGRQRRGLRQPPLVRRRQAVRQRLRAQVEQQVRLRLQSCCNTLEVASGYPVAVAPPSADNICHQYPISWPSALYVVLNCDDASQPSAELAAAAFSL